jgi:quercetin dioxygenase-like cupin family protein
VIGFGLGIDLAGADGPAKVTPLLAKDLAGVSGKEVVMSTVEYPPGGRSAAHRHDANVMVYVLEGSLSMQVDGHDPVTLKPGDTFYESPDDVHRISANASKTAPAKFLVVMVKDKDKPPTRPVAGASAP